MDFKEIKYKLFEDYQKGIISDDDLIDLIDFASGYLSLQTTTTHAKRINKSYNGVKNHVFPDLVIDGINFYKLTI